MNENRKVKAQEWFEKGKHDLETVKMILDSSGHPDVASVLLQQGIEKYLKGYLIFKGWKLIKIHDLKKLLDKAVNYNVKFKEFYDLLDKITGYYFEERYPIIDSGIELSEIEKDYNEVQKIIKIILEEIGGIS